MANPYDDSNRYQTRASYKKDSYYDANGNSHFHNSDRELFPNCVRIEPLSAGARRAYLSGLSGIYDSIKFAFLEKLSPEVFKPFYGILSSNAESGLGFGISSTWSPAEQGDYKAIVRNLAENPLFASSIGGSIGIAAGGDSDNDKSLYAALGSGVGGLMSAIENFTNEGTVDNKSASNSLLNKTMQTYANLNDRLSHAIGKRNDDDIYGMNVSSVGSCTMKRFKNSSFKFDKSLNFSWYLPEQEDLFRLSIRRLMKLAYVRTLNDSNIDLSKRLKQATSAAQKQSYIGLNDLSKSISGLATNIGDTAQKTINVIENMNSHVTEKSVTGGQIMASAVSLGTSASDLAKKYNPLNEYSQTLDTTANNLKENSSYAPKNENGAQSGLDDAMEKNSELIASFITTLNESYKNILGVENVAIPFPVRLTIGNIIDIEPLVITGVTINPSKELFVNRIGAHLPVTVSVTVTFDQWLNPRPDSEFLSFLGDNIFSIYGRNTN